MELVDPKGQKADRVRFGASVTVCDESDNEKTYRIVGVDEAEPGVGKVSWLSPIAKALIGGAEGDVRRVELPQGEVELEILDIEYS
jgi:transcription elongation factor GreB